MRTCFPVPHVQPQPPVQPLWLPPLPTQGLLMTAPRQEGWQPARLNTNNYKILVVCRALDIMEC
jgi:hypothetical protein